MSQPLSIMWFRHDLRLRDNPALLQACKSDHVIAIYIYDNKYAGEFEMGAASKWWLHHSLQKLNDSLEGNLHVLSGDPD